MASVLSHSIKTGYSPVAIVSNWSGWRELNPHVRVGNATGGHYITPALLGLSPNRKLFVSQAESKLGPVPHPKLLSADN